MIHQKNRQIQKTFPLDGQLLKAHGIACKVNRKNTSTQLQDEEGLGGVKDISQFNNASLAK